VTATDPAVRLGIVSGRRRQGKTFLLDALATSAGGFFHTAADETETDALARFGAALAACAGGGRYVFDDWDQALERLFAVVPDGLIVLDEFPYLSRASPSLPSLIQRALDPRGCARRSRARLLLCGSAMSVMGRLLSGTAPLRGRASLELILRPLAYRNAARFWGLANPQLAVLVHSIVGGTPAYRREFVASDAPSSLSDFDDWVLRAVLNPQMPLFREARYLLAEEADIRDTAIYHAVLGAIASGNATRGRIANCMGRRSPDIGHPLAVLEDAHLITRVADPLRKARSIYRISEPLIVFYEAVMRREWTRLERGDTTGAWRNSESTFLSRVVGPNFEEICREWTLTDGSRLLADVPSEASECVVNDPRHRAQIQIDVAAFGAEEPGRPRRVLSLGEAKWDRVMNIGHLERLRRASDLLSAQGLDTRDAVLVCYSGGGFDDELQEAARGNQKVRLVGLDLLYS
jgi:uncharacterized protein